MKYSVSAKTVSRRTHEQEVGAVLPEPFGVAEEGVRPNHRISGLLLLTYLLTYLLTITYLPARDVHLGMPSEGADTRPVHAIGRHAHDRTRLGGGGRGCRGVAEWWRWCCYCYTVKGTRHVGAPDVAVPVVVGTVAAVRGEHASGGDATPNRYDR